MKKISPLEVAAISAILGVSMLAGVVDAQQMTSPGAGLYSPTSAPTVIGNTTSSSSTTTTNTTTTAPSTTTTPTPVFTPTTTTTTPTVPTSTQPTVTPTVSPTSTVVTPTTTSVPSPLLTAAWPPLNPPMPAVVSITSDGRILVRGTVTAINGNLISLQTWGGEWNIMADNTLSITPALTSFNIGDFVGVIGSVSTTLPATVNATVIRDWTATP